MDFSYYINQPNYEAISELADYLKLRKPLTETMVTEIKKKILPSNYLPAPDSYSYPCYVPLIWYISQLKVDNCSKDLMKWILSSNIDVNLPVDSKNPNNIPLPLLLVAQPEYQQHLIKKGATIREIDSKMFKEIIFRDHAHSLLNLLLKHRDKLEIKFSNQLTSRELTYFYFDVIRSIIGRIMFSLQDSDNKSAGVKEIISSGVRSYRLLNHLVPLDKNWTQLKSSSGKQTLGNLLANYYLFALIKELPVPEQKIALPISPDKKGNLGSLLRPLLNDYYFGQTVSLGKEYFKF